MSDTERAHQKAIMVAHLEPMLDDLIHDHHQSNFAWYPSELMPSSEGMSIGLQTELELLQERAKGIPDAVRLAMVLNILTEEGLPMYHRMLYEAFGRSSSWSYWRNLWTAEEDRHGNLLRDYTRDARLINMVALDEVQYNFLSMGWDPDWCGDAYATLAYTALQEKATQVSHRNIGRLVAKFEPTLVKILSRITGDEVRHQKFYCALFKKLIEADYERAILSLLNVIKVFTMPGKNVSLFKELSDVEHALGVFGPCEFSEVVEDVIEQLGLRRFINVGSERAQKTLDTILNYPERLRKIHHRVIGKIRENVTSYQIDLIYNRPILLDVLEIA